MEWKYQKVYVNTAYDLKKIAIKLEKTIALNHRRFIEKKTFLV